MVKLKTGFIITNNEGVIVKIFTRYDPYKKIVVTKQINNVKIFKTLSNAQEYLDTYCHGFQNTRIYEICLTEVCEK